LANAAGDHDTPGIGHNSGDVPEAADGMPPSAGEGTAVEAPDPTDLLRIISALYRRSLVGMFLIEISGTPLNADEQPSVYTKIQVPSFNYADPTVAPTNPDGTAWEWHGPGEQGSPWGAYVNPENPGQSMHPNLDHDDPIGPHWDFNDRIFGNFRIDPNLQITPK
jgi:hypothetical protein